ncbi:hypothetical protein Mth01_34150 [Sphaerimonospora thailandensis]|uniref:Uncharacterized protein n=1 Tax=Sphaerimonospora thailandensis TaxID=795644 RepID=A0A8J3W044_9ACTN|nr:hypothetical protein Mth01_34150 [Sphaerimonospora thailandensis]
MRAIAASAGSRGETTPFRTASAWPTVSNDSTSSNDSTPSTAPSSRQQAKPQLVPARPGESETGPIDRNPGEFKDQESDQTRVNSPFGANPGDLSAEGYRMVTDPLDDRHAAANSTVQQG